MSHVTAIELDIAEKNERDLLLAGEDCGLERRDKSSYRWYGTHVGDYPIPEGFSKQELGRCSYALGIKGDPSAYELGVVRRDGKLHLLYDFYGTQGRRLKSRVGENGSKLKQAFAEFQAGTFLKHG